LDINHSFRLGAKLIALYYLILALPVLLGLVVSILPITAGGVGSLNVYGFAFLPALFSPVILAVIGIYILRDGALFQRLADSNDDSDSAEKMADCFALGVKLLGVHFVLGSIPTLSTTVSNFLFVANWRDSSAAGVAQGLGVRTNFLPQPRSF
jgi:hypothetical protein